MLLDKDDRAPTMTVFFSIIIATFNRPAALSRALDSVLAQDYKNYEIIVINDGSTDEYGFVLEKYSKFIKYLCNSCTSGVSIARNRGILAAKGAWTIFLDDDDEFESGYFTYLHEYITKKEIAFAFLWCSLKHVVRDDSGAESSSHINFSEQITNREQLCDVALTIGASYGLVIDSEVYAHVGLFDSSYQVAEDTEFVIRMLKKNVQPFPLEKIGVIKYNTSSDSLSFDYRRYSSLGVYERIFNAHGSFLKSFPESYYKLVNWAAFIHFKNGNFPLGDKALREMFLFRPFNRTSIDYFIGGKVFKLSVRYPVATRVIKNIFTRFFKKS